MVYFTHNQWWILGEASEAIALGPPFLQLSRGPPFLKMLHVVLFCGILHGFMNLKNSQKFQLIGEIYVT